MRRIALLLLLPAACLLADVTGKWAGGAQDDDHKLFFVLKQDGSTLTGSAGPSEDNQHSVQNGKVEGDRVTFDVPVGDKGTIHFDLKASGDEIKGEVQLNRADAGTEVHKVALKKVAT